jgi:hypothetical protein
VGILNARRYSEVAYCVLRLECWTGSEKSRYPSAVMYQFTDIFIQDTLQIAQQIRALANSDFARVRLVVP